jgi:DNA polymerase
MLSKPVEGYAVIPKPPEICGPCPLWGTGQGFSTVEGLGTLGVHLVGEALGQWEEADGLPFRPQAPAGSVLERALRLAGLTREQLIIHNVLRCRPPGNLLEGEPYEADAIAHCRRHFERVLAAHPPRVLVALGSTALKALTGLAGEDLHIGDLRGYVLDSDYGPVVPTYHPSYLRRGSSKFRDEETGGLKTKSTTGPGMALLGTLVHDLQRAVRVAAGVDSSFLLHPEFSDYFDDYQERPSLDDALAFLGRVRDCPQALLAYDLEHPFASEEPDEEADGDDGAALIETLTRSSGGREIYSIQFSLGRREGIYFPWEGAYIDVARDILAHGNPKAGHFVRKSDNPRLESWGIRPAGPIYDTWEAFHHLQPDVPAKLQAVASYMYYSLVPGRGIYDPFPFPWKHWRQSAPERYGIIDVDVIHWILPRLHNEIRRAGLERGYQQVLALNQYIFPAMTARGVPVDAERHRALRGEFEQVAASLDAEIRALAPDAARLVRHPEGYQRAPAVVRQALNAAQDARQPPPQRVEGPDGETYVARLDGGERV